MNMTIDQKALDATIKHMVQRFLMWKLPENFNPDGGIQFVKRTDYGHTFEPVGTNLFDYTQATAMVRHMLDGVDLAALGGSAEPVAWMLRQPNGKLLWDEVCVWHDEGAVHEFMEENELDNLEGYTRTPLYLHPAPPSADRAALEAEIERLKQALAFADEQAAKIEALLDPHVKWGDAALSAPAPASDADKRIAELEAALKPFAALADEMFRVDDDGYQMNISKTDDRVVWGYDGKNITYGDFRFARRALNGGGNV